MIRGAVLAALLLGARALAQDVAIVQLSENSADVTQTGTASIAGAVVNSVTNEPVKKAQVMLLGAPQNSHQPPTAVTDASGSFTFSRLPPGTFTLQASHPSFDQNRDSILGENQQAITIVADQHVTGITLRVTPNGSLSGHLSDEYGDPVSSCQVIASVAGSRPGSPMNREYAANADDRGEYRIAFLPGGRYLVHVHCHRTLSAPHGFMARDDPRRPELAFVPEFYGGTATTRGASSISVQPGAEVQGIDFRLKTAAAITLRIAVVSDQAFDRQQLEVDLGPSDFQSMLDGASWNEKAGAFLARGLVAGAYTIHARSRDEDAPLFGEAEAVVADDVAKPVTIQLSPPMTLTGAVQLDPDQKGEPMQPREVMLMPLTNGRGFPPPHGQVNKDGSFTLGGIVPGRYMVHVEGVAGAIRSATLGQHDISPYDFEIGPGASGPLNLTITSKQIPVTVSISPADSSHTAWVLAIPRGSEEAIAFGPQGMQSVQVEGASAQISVTPGKYTMYALESAQPWPVISDQGIMAAIADHGKPLEVKDDTANANVTVDMITRDDLRFALQRETQ